LRVQRQLFHLAEGQSRPRRTTGRSSFFPSRARSSAASRRRTESTSSAQRDPERERAWRNRRILLEREIAPPGGERAIEEEDAVLPQETVASAGGITCIWKSTETMFCPLFAACSSAASAFSASTIPFDCKNRSSDSFGIVAGEVLGRAAAEADLQHPTLVQLELETSGS